MNTILQKTWVKLLLLSVVAVGVFFVVTSNRLDTQQVYVAATHDIQQAVLLSGSVKAIGQVDLSFDASGKVSEIKVAQGDVVLQGQVIAELDYNTLKADLLQARGILQSAESNVSLARASVQKADANLSLVRAQNRGTDSSIEAAQTLLDNVIREQETLVNNAYKELLNNNLTAYPVDNSRNVASPIVSGSYEGEITGEYTLDFYSSGGTTGYSVRVLGIGTGVVSFDDYGIPSSLGAEGLYLTLPTAGEGSSYANTDWVIPVPNNRSATYQTKLGAYEKAKQVQVSAVATAQSNLDILIAQQASGESLALTTAQEQQAVAALEEARAKLAQARGAVTQAQAGVAKVQAQIESNILYAPFEGTVARLEFEVGQSVTPQNTGVTVVTDGEFELTMSIPENDISKIAVGDTAEIILDAYNADVVWYGVLSEIELVETEIDGVPSYSSIITVSEPDDRIKIGMNARARIVAEERTSVVAVPLSYVVKKDTTSVVFVKVNDRQTEEREVKTGLVGTDYFVEILSGLKNGETIINPTDT